MIFPLLTIVIVLCQSLFTPCLATSQPTSTRNFQTQELENKAGTTDILSKYVSTEFGIFKINVQRTSWNDARNICLNGKAQLAVIDSAGEEAMLLEYMKANKISTVWLGVHDLFAKNQWTTIKGDSLYSLGYLHWAKGEPNNAGGKEDCVALHENGMNDSPCKTLMGFVYEKSTV